MIVGGTTMSKKLFIVLISVFGALCALSAAVAAFMIIKDKKRRDDSKEKYKLYEEHHQTTAQCVVQARNYLLTESLRQTSNDTQHNDE